jgi:1-deoxy-D-xylulose-5-phosphate synthase
MLHRARYFLNQKKTYLKIPRRFGLTVLDLAKKKKKIIGITPAMPSGSSLKFMMEALPERAFDVGIAEQHAVTLAAGMATQGMHVYCNIYSTFYKELTIKLYTMLLYKIYQ